MPRTKVVTDNEPGDIVTRLSVVESSVAQLSEGQNRILGAIENLEKKENNEYKTRAEAAEKRLSENKPAWFTIPAIIASMLGVAVVLMTSIGNLIELKTNSFLIMNSSIEKRLEKIERKVFGQ